MKEIEQPVFNPADQFVTDLSNCDREPIHIPGSIQPNGMLLVANDDNILTHAGSNSLPFLRGRTRLGDVLGEEILAGLNFDDIVPDRPHFYSFIETSAVPELPGTWALSAHRYDGRRLVGLEKINEPHTVDNLAAWLQKDVANISRAQNIESMMDALAGATKAISGFDRTMVYSFDRDWHGEVIAESRGNLASSYLGLHFPASDIPVQARHLYTRQILRIIEDINYKPVPVVKVREAESDRPVDLSFCDFRSVSPIHVEYLQNMGVTASLVASLIIGDRLWGLLVCHHYSGTIYVPPRVRAVIQAVSFFASGQVARLEELNAAKLRAAAFAATAIPLVDSKSERDFLNGIADAFPALSDIFDLQAVAARSDQNPKASGSAAAPAGRSFELPADILIADRLPPELLLASGCAPDIVGGAIITLDATKGAFVLLGRVEERRIVNWAGNPDKPMLSTPNASERLHPRLSFELWQQETHDRCKPWTSGEIEALYVVSGRLRMFYALAAQRGLEGQLNRAHRLSAVGELTGGIAHDFNNLLTAIIGNLELVMEDETAATGHDLVKIALDAADRASSLTNQLLAFGRRQTLQPCAIDAAKLISQVVDLLRRTIDVRYTLASDVPSGVSQVLADPTLLESALINLIINARDAMPTGGAIIISAVNFDVTDELAQALVMARGSYVMISVQDSGTGIPLEIRDRVFEPFFTTKAMGSGTGLGLSMVFGFAKQSGGSIDIGDAPGGGALVRIFLPAVSVRAAPDVSVEPVQELKDGEHVLVVEDQPDVGDTLMRHLEALGYRTSRVFNAEAALTLLSGQDAKFDLVITDIGLPGMDGGALARLLRQKYPFLPVLLTTGFATEAQLAELMRETPPFLLLRKPFRRRELYEILNRCIERQK